MYILNSIQTLLTLYILIHSCRIICSIHQCSVWLVYKLVNSSPDHSSELPIIPSSNILDKNPLKGVIPNSLWKLKRMEQLKFFPFYSARGFSCDENMVKFHQELKPNPLQQSHSHQKSSVWILKDGNLSQRVSGNLHSKWSSFKVAQMHCLISINTNCASVLCYLW